MFVYIYIYTYIRIRIYIYIHIYIAIGTARYRRARRLSIDHPALSPSLHLCIRWSVWVHPLSDPYCTREQIQPTHPPTLVKINPTTLDKINLKNSLLDGFTVAMENTQTWNLSWMFPHINILTYVRTYLCTYVHTHVCKNIQRSIYIYIYIQFALPEPLLWRAPSPNWILECFPN